MDKKKILFIVGGIFIVISSYFLFDAWMYATTDNAQIDAHSSLLAAKVPGYILDVPVVLGSKVQKGQVLVQLDDRDYKANYEAAQSEVLSLEAKKNDAEKNYQRVKDLYAKNVVSQQQYDSTSAAYHEVRAKYDSAHARAKQAQLNIEYSQIKAPSDGVVARISAEQGQLASAGMPLVGFVSSESRWVTANFKETDIQDIQKGRFAKVEVDALSGKTFPAEVEHISAATGATFTLLPPDNATGNFTKVVQRIPVRIQFKNLSAADIDLLQAGLSVIVKVKKH